MKKMIKKGLAALLLAGIAACMPMQALAVTAQYSTTQAFLDAMDAEQLRYTWKGVDNDGDERVEVSFNGDNMSAIKTIWFFDQDLDRVSVRVWDVIKYDGSAIDQLYPSLNKVNADYKFVCFYADDYDDTVTAKVDAEITPESAGTTCVNLLFTVVNITDEAYTTLAPYDTDGN